MTQTQENGSQNCLFTTMRATAEEHGAFRIQPSEAGLMLGLFNFRHLTVGIVFDAANNMDSLSRNTERCPPISIFPLLYANQNEKPESRRGKKSKLPISSLRSNGSPRLDQH